MRSFEANILAEGGVLVKELSYVDCYYDSEALQLTRTDHFLRTRNDLWELKVPRRESGKAASVYEEIEGEGLIGQYFGQRYPHGKVLMPWLGNDFLSMDDEAPSSPGSGGGTTPPALSPFVEFGTARRRYTLEFNGSALFVDVDEASFCCCVAEIELMVRPWARNASGG